MRNIFVRNTFETFTMTKRAKLIICFKIDSLTVRKSKMADTMVGLYRTHVPASKISIYSVLSRYDLER